jgi:hypothetical protein
MKQFFEWIASLNPNQSFGAFALVCALMAVFPYASTILNWLKLKFGNQDPEILDFSWRISQDHFLMSSNGKKYYLNSSNQNFILEGGKLIINWHVKGAYRVDVLPIGKKLKGNTAMIAARRQQNEFKLIAYTAKGRLEKSLVIDPKLFRELSTVNLSKENQFEQDAQVRKTIAFTTANTILGRYRNGKLGQLPKIQTKILSTSTNRIQYPKQISQLKAWHERKIWKAAQSRYFRANNFHGVAFNPSKYNAAMRSNENDKLIS